MKICTSWVHLRAFCFFWSDPSVEWFVNRNPSKRFWIYRIYIHALVSTSLHTVTPPAIHKNHWVLHGFRLHLGSRGCGMQNTKELEEALEALGLGRPVKPLHKPWMSVEVVKVSIGTFIKMEKKQIIHCCRYIKKHHPRSVCTAHLVSYRVLYRMDPTSHP